MSGCEEEAASISYGVIEYKKELSEYILDEMCNRKTYNGDVPCVVCEDCAGCMAGNILKYMNKEVYEDEYGKRYIRNRT